MSTGAEVGIVAVPLIGVGVLAAGALALAAGVVAVGGVVLVGTGRLALASGRYAAERVRARASLCASEYAAYQQDYARALAVVCQSRGPTYAAQRAAAKEATLAEQAARRAARAAAAQQPADTAPEVERRVLADLDQNLSADHDRFTDAVRVIELRATLHAAAAVDGPLLAPALQTQVSRALESAEPVEIQAAYAALRRARAEARQSDLAQAQLRLREHDEEVAGLLEGAVDPSVLEEGFAWRRALAADLSSADRLRLQRLLDEGDQRLYDWRIRSERAAIALRAQELAGLWGRVQAVAGLFADLHALVQAGVLSASPAQQALLDEAVKRYQALEHAPLTDLPALRQEAATVAALLDGCEQYALGLLASYYRQQIATEVETLLPTLDVDGLRFETVERRVETDGSIGFRCRHGAQFLDVVVRADGSLKYDAHRFGDERCLKIVYGLLDGLFQRGVRFEQHDPELTKQAQMVVLVREAIKQLGGYTDEQISVYDDAGVARIEAHGGIGFQTVEVDEDNNVRVVQGPTSPATSTAEIVGETQKPRTKKGADERIRQARPVRQKQTIKRG